MDAVLIATQISPAMGRLGARYPSGMLPLIDRPFIQHIVEYLAGRGVARFEVVVAHLPEKIEALLEDGRRWGVRIRYHLVTNPEHPYRPLGLLERPAQPTAILLGHADRLVLTDVSETRPERPDAGPVLYDAPEGAGGAERGRMKWTGWGWIPWDRLAGIGDDFGENALHDHIQRDSGDRLRRIPVSCCLGVQSGRDLIESNRRVLAQKGAGLLVGGREVEPGIWLSRNVSLHPTAELVAPVYIGADCRIARGARIGPDAVLGRNCVVGEKSTIAETVVLQGSYIGDALELKDAIVDKNCLINVHLGSEVLIREDFILGSMEQIEFNKGWRRLLSRVAAGLLLVPALPLIACAALYGRLLRGGPFFTTRPVVRLPAEEDPMAWNPFFLFGLNLKPAEAADPIGGDRVPAGWRHFLFLFLPALVNIARGELGFVGLPPRTVSEIQALPSDWRAIYLKGKAGLVTECLVRFGPGATDDERYAADAVYAVSTTAVNDLKLLGRYIGQVFGFLPLPETMSKKTLSL